jgi:hypothetical protein
MDMNNYPHVTIAEDGRLCSTGHHRPGIPRVLYDTLLHLGYNGDVPIYRAHMSIGIVTLTRGMQPSTILWSIAMRGQHL